MTQLVEFSVGDDQAIMVALPDRGSDVTVRGLHRQSATSERAALSFEQAVAKVRPAAEALVSQLVSMARTPDEIAVEFGLGLSAEVGIFITSATTTANFKVSLTWRRPVED